MQSQRILTRYKQKLLIFLSTLFIVILLQPNQTCNTFNQITAHAQTDAGVLERRHAERT